MTYLPGTHVIASLTAKTPNRLDDPQALQTAIDGWIAECRLQKLGDIYHHFDPSGFTAVICLSESHISVHTWPEYGRVNLDIYLSNYERDNDGTVRALYDSLVRWFDGDILQEQIIRR
jgi:S-adenosylmethionine decarboxylase